jgi:hypothetical protein
MPFVRGVGWLVAVVVLLPLLGAASCPPPPPKSACAFKPPATTSIPVPPAATPASDSQVDIEIDHLYLAARLKDLVETRDVDECQTPTQNGVSVQGVSLSEATVGNAVVHLLTVSLAPWMRGQSGAHASLQRNYRLRLQLVPSLVSAATVPDVAARTRLLCGTDPACTQTQLCSNADKCNADCRATGCDVSSCGPMCQPSAVPALACPPNPTCNVSEGLLLAFRLYDLTNVSSGALVAGADGACTAACDVIDQPIVQALNGSLAKSPPMLLPTAKIEDIVKTVTGVSPSVVGVAIASQTDLKIGLRLDQGVPTPFGPDAFQTHLPRGDWAVRLATSFIADKIDMIATNAVQSTGGPIAVLRHPVGVDFTSAGIEVTANVSVKNCPNFAKAEKETISPSVCKDSSSSSVLKMCVTAQSEEDHSVGTGTICAAWEGLKQSFKGGWAVATTSSSSSACPLSQQVQFLAGRWANADDTFFATGVDTDGVFYLMGRSTVMDGLVAAQGSPRPAAPPACPP